MHIKKKGFLLVFVFGLMMFSGTLLKAQEITEVVVRAIAKDAKLIGSSMGGVMVTIKNTKTGEMLAKGLTEGSTGDTKKLVISPKKRYEQVSTEGSAKFTAHLNIEQPVFATISATSTYRNEQEVTSSTQMWLIPGMDILGDGIMLEMPGFVVDIIEVQPYKTDEPGAKVKAKVVMMCGCPTKPGGLWDSSKFKIQALIKKDGEVVKTVPLTFSGKTNIYDGHFTVNQPDSYTITVTVFDPRTANSGLAAETVMLN